MNRILSAAALAAAFAATGAFAQTEIQWWHSMGGALGDKVNDLPGKFNASQKDYKVVPVFKGSYPESMTAAIAAYRACAKGLWPAWIAALTAMMFQSSTTSARAAHGLITTQRTAEIVTRLSTGRVRRTVAGSVMVVPPSARMLSHGVERRTDGRN